MAGELRGSPLVQPHPEVKSPGRRLGLTERFEFLCDEKTRGEQPRPGIEVTGWRLTDSLQDVSRPAVDLAKAGRALFRGQFAEVIDGFLQTGPGGSEGLVGLRPGLLGLCQGGLLLLQG